MVAVSRFEVEQLVANGADVVTIDDVAARLLPRPAWFARAACRGMATASFFPEHGCHPERIAEAKRLCAGRAVSDECTAYATGGDGWQHHGIYGGCPGGDARQAPDRPVEPSPVH